MTEATPKLDAEPAEPPAKANTEPAPPPNTEAVLLARLESLLQPLTKSVDELSRGLAKFQRRLETVELDSGMTKEHLLRQAAAPPYREPVRPDSETSGDGFSSYPWERKPATPRLS